MKRFIPIGLFSIIISVIMVILVFTLLVVSFCDIKFGLDTFWDEGFYIQWLKYPENYKSVTQSFNIISMFGDYHNYSIYYLRIIRFIVQLFTIGTFSFFTLKWLRSQNPSYSKKFLINFFLVIILFGIPSLIIFSKTICFRHLQQLFALYSF